MNKVAIYARVSTNDKGQDPEMQLVPINSPKHGILENNQGIF